MYKRQILTSIIKKGATVFRTMYFIPVVTTASIVGIIMIFIFGGTGPVNQVLSMLGIDTINFLGDAKTAMFTVVLIGVWKDLGTYMIYWIAALQSVPQDVYCLLYTSTMAIQICVPLLKGIPVELTMKIMQAMDTPSRNLKAKNW